MLARGRCKLAVNLIITTVGFGRVLHVRDDQLDVLDGKRRELRAGNRGRMANTVQGDRLTCQSARGDLGHSGREPARSEVWATGLQGWKATQLGVRGSQVRARRRWPDDRPVRWTGLVLTPAFRK